MTRLVARLVLAMLLLPLSGTLLVLTFAFFIGRGQEPEPIEVLGMWSVVYAFIALYWLLLWRDVVQWTPVRRRRTWLWAVAAVGVGTLIGWLLVKGLRGPWFLGMFVGGGVPPIIWVLATVLIWRETPQERIDRVGSAGQSVITCPLCGYNMTGLNECRCPECGAKFTVDQLLAGQPQRDQIES